MRAAFTATFAVVAFLLSLSCPLRASFILTNNTNITLANIQSETGDDFSANPNVAIGTTGSAVSYTASANSFGGNYTLPNLYDGDVGVGVPSDGTYAIVLNGTPLTLAFNNGVQTIGSIAIYNGYTNRDDGTYLIRDALNNTLGGYTISTAPGGTNNGADSFWLTFNTPVTTSSLSINFVSSDINTASFREIQIFAVPEPNMTAFSVLVVAGVSAVRRLRKKTQP